METFQIRTDLALEARESVNEEESRLRGVSVEERYEEEQEKQNGVCQTIQQHEDISMTRLGQMLVDRGMRTGLEQ